MLFENEKTQGEQEERGGALDLNGSIVWDRTSAGEISVKSSGKKRAREWGNVKSSVTTRVRAGSLSLSNVCTIKKRVPEACH